MKYFTGELKKGFTALYISELFMLTVSGLLGVFLPIFFFELFNESFVLVATWYFLVSVLYLFLVPYGAQLLNTIGYKRCLQLSSLLSASLYFCFYIVEASTIWFYIPLSIIILVLWKMFFWIPYHIELIALSDTKNRGKQISVILATASAIGVIMPIISGYIITEYSIDILFIIAVGCFLATAIPYNFLPKTNEVFTWSYKKTWQQFLSKKHRHLTLSLAGQGAESIVGGVVWPIFIFQVLDGNYFDVGALSTLVVGATIILQLGVGNILDKIKSSKNLIKISTSLYSLGWILKIFVATGFHIFAASLYHKVMHIFIRAPFDTEVFEMAASQGHYVDEFTAIRDMAIVAGKSLGLIFIVLISLYLPLQTTFIVAAVSSLLLNFIFIDKIKLH